LRCIPPFHYYACEPTENLNLLASAGAVELHRLLQSSLVHMHIGQLNESPFFELEGQSLKASPTRGASAAGVKEIDGGAPVGRVVLDLPLGRVRKIVAGSVEHRLDTCILDS